MYLLHLTFISSISHFHIFYKHIPHKTPIHTPHISSNTRYHKKHTYIHIYFLLSPHILKHIKHSSKNMLQKLFLMEGIIYNAKSPSYGRQKLIKIKSPSYGRQYHSCLTKKLKEHYMGKII